MHTEVAADERTRRARHLIPRDLPRRGEALAAVAVLVVLAHLLFAQLTGVLALALLAIGRTTRWRLSWLAAPAGAGLIWTLAVGPGPAVAGLLAGPAHVLWYITGGGVPLEHLIHPAAAFSGLGSWLPRQLPLALVTGSAEAAIAGGLSWLRTGPARRPAYRPGLVAALRRRMNLRRLRSDQLLARGAAALGVDPVTGGAAGLPWRNVAGGVLVTGAAEHEVTTTALRLAKAALRRRKPVLVVDLDRHAGIVSALRDACARSGNPWFSDADIGAVVRLRAVALLRMDGDAGAAARIGAAVLETCRDLRRIGVDGDGLVWVRGCEGLPAPMLAALVAEGAAAGLPLLLSTTDATAAEELSRLVEVRVVHRRAGEFVLAVRGREPVRVVTS